MIDTVSMPQRGQRWLSRPPYLMVAQILGVEEGPELPLVSYALYDEDGYLLGEERAVLDQGWWHAFQPIRGAYG